LSPFEPDNAAIKAGRLMLEEIARYEKRGASFAFETTLSGLGYLRCIRRWRAQGYHVSLFFLTLPSVETAITRVATRVNQGGHDIPEGVIRRRFATGLKNFNQHYRNAVDDWVLYDNTNDVPTPLDWGENHEPT